MRPKQYLIFSPFCFDPDDERLWHGSQLLSPRPKIFAVLRYLVEHPGRLVTRDELLKAVWPSTYVSEGLLRGYIRELRGVLGDDAKTPRFIETVARRGYRFIAPVRKEVRVHSLESELVPSSQSLTPTLVGREAELGQLQGWLEKALGGERQVVFVTGEPGMGKTTLVEAFLEQAAAMDLWIARGQCVDHYGAGEAYLPVLEALGRLCREPGGESLITFLGQHAPTWLVQMPALLNTARPEDMSVGKHPLKAIKQALHLHRQCEELPLEFLTEAEVAGYLAMRFAESSLPTELARAIHQRTEGNPLFIVNMVDYLLAQGLLVEGEGQWELQGQVVERGMPEGLRQMIENQVEGLSAEEQSILEAASVAGVEFSAAAVAAALGQDTIRTEEQCEELVRRRRFLRSSGIGEWPDGTLAARYGFIHALYQDVLYERAAAGRRIQLHRQIGEREEQGYREQASEIAAELAMRFERGRDYGRAVHYRGQAGEKAIRRCANQEAIAHLTRGLELLNTLSDTPERTWQELTLQITLGVPLMTTKGWSAPEVERAYSRARELCEQVGEAPQLFPVLWGLWAYYFVAGPLQTARELGEQCLRLAQSAQDPDLLVEVHSALGPTLYFLGEYVLAREYLEQGIALYDPQKHHSHAFLYGGTDPGVFCLSYAAWTLWFLGYPDQALKRIHEVLNLAQKQSHPQPLAWALIGSVLLHHLRREGQLTQEQAEAAITLSTEQGFALQLTMGTILRGWALAEQGQIEEGITQLRQGLAAFQSMGAEVGRSHFLALLAEGYGKAGRTKGGVNTLVEALDFVNKNGERFYEAELYRLKGELLLMQENQKLKGKGQKAKIEEAEECFHKAIDIARGQSARSLELRAVMSLSRLWQKQGKNKEARQLLQEIYNWFTEGFATADLKEARVLLEELEGKAVTGDDKKDKSAKKKSAHKTD